MINTIIVEDNKYIQKHFANLIAADERFYLTDVVADAFEAEKLCYKGVDLILMDVLTLHRHSGLAAGRRIKEKWPNIKVVIITSLIDPEILAKAKTGCADSLWYKDHSSKEVLEVIERTLAGEKIFPDCSPVIKMENMFSDEISPAQLEILRCYIHDGADLRLYSQRDGAGRLAGAARSQRLGAQHALYRADKRRDPGAADGRFSRRQRRAAPGIFDYRAAADDKFRGYAVSDQRGRAARACQRRTAERQSGVRKPASAVAGAEPVYHDDGYPAL